MSVFSYQGKKLITIIALFIIIMGVFFTGTVFANDGNIYENSDVPLIQPRSAWEDSSQLQALLKITRPRFYNAKSLITPTYYPVSRIVVYDTACPIYLPDGSRNKNCNSIQQQPIPLIQNIYRYHVLNKGYNDIAYHFIIGWNGEIFEGHYGGNGSVSQHFSGTGKCYNYNIGTISVLLLANIEQERPSLAMQKSLARLVGWLSMANDLNPANLDKISWLWQNSAASSLQQRVAAGKAQKCDPEKGRFVSQWKAPTVLFYQALYRQKFSLHLDMQALRREAQLLAQKFRKYLYTAATEAPVWRINKGSRIQEPKIGLRVIKINKAQLEYFPSQKKFILRDGDIIRLQGRNDLYLFQKGICRRIVSLESFKAWQFNKETIKEVPLVEMRQCKFGLVLSYPPGSLLRFQGDTKVFLVNQNGTISHISSLPLFRLLGYRWKNVLVISQSEAKELKKAKPILFPTGSLIKGPEDMVYLVSAEVRQPIKTLSIFQAHHFNWKDVIQLPKQEIDLYPLRDELGYPDNVLLASQQEDEKIYFLKGGRRNLLKNQKLRPSLSLISPHVIRVSNRELLKYPLGVSLESKSDIDKLNRAIQSEKGDFLNIARQHLYQQFVVAKIKLADLAPQDEFDIYANKDYNIEKDNGKIHAKTAQSLYHIKVGDITKELKITSKSGNAVFTIAKASINLQRQLEGKRYRGSIKIVAYPTNAQGSLKYFLINEVLLEDYLKGVKEDSLQETNLTVLRALSVAQRSYALHYIKSRGGQELPFYLSTHERGIIYGGYDAETFYKSQAVEQTEGEILEYNQEPIIALYSRDSCGLSKDARLVWGSFYNQLPYLWGGVRDPQGTKHNLQCPFIHNSPGVGMSVAGAFQLSKLRKNYKEILEYYYPNTYFKKIY